MEQLDIFGAMYGNYKITKPIKLIELFAGYGSQNLALKYLNANYEHYKICEWATKSIQAYNDLHIQDYNDYSKPFTYEEILNFLYSKGISLDYNSPMAFDQIKRKGEKWCRKTYNDIIATNNLVNIQQVHADDLEIVDTDKYEYILTYSFPCQDLSLAGELKGMEKGSGTRSGMLWEVERILKECNNLPQILFMENVTQVHSVKNRNNFEQWIKSLEALGYKNYWQDLNSKDYGIPQNRNRTFMVSIIGNGNYSFPKKEKLELRLKNMLESKVNEKYFLSPKMIKYIANSNEKWTGNNDKALINKEIASTINTAEGSRRCDASNYICDDLPEEFDLKFGNENLNETLEKNKDIESGDFIDAYNKKVRKDGLCGTILTGIDFRNKHFVAVDESILKKLRIRKLTPKECFRLMGLKDEDIDKISKQADSSLYHLAGDSIVVNVLMAIFKEMV